MTSRHSASSPHTVVIGAGVGGLTAGALLLQAGHRVTVLEAQTYPGGCAGTFFHKGYRFDAGATLAGGFNVGGPHARLAEQLDLSWPVRPADPAWSVHLPDGRVITQWADRQRWRDTRREAFPGAAAERFWRRQEALADIAWDLSRRPLPWPPAGWQDLLTLGRALRPGALRALPYLLASVGSFIPHDPWLRLFLDAQLLIAAQTTADQTGALYGSAALDLPRRGVNHVRGGIGSLAQTLVDWIREHGGEVRYRQRVTAIDVRRGRAVAVRTHQGQRLGADHVLANLTPWALRDLLGEAAPARLRRELTHRASTWGAFTLYLGLDASDLNAILPAGGSQHHQVIVDPGRPLGEGNSVFISLGDPEDPGRAPAGHRPATLSTHTAVEPWWALRRGLDEAAYLARRERYTARLLAAAEQALPGFGRAVRLCLPGTPVTFAFYTGRPEGMVGGFPQRSLLTSRGPHTGIANLLLVGDSVFPGQSTAGVNLGAYRVAAEVARQAERPRWWPASAYSFSRRWGNRRTSRMVV